MKDIVVMFVDDEPNVLHSLERNLIREPYTRVFMSSAQEALACLEKTPAQVVVTDMRMPVMDGLTFLRIVKDRYPEMVRMVLSGYTEVPRILETINSGEVFRYVTKPIQDPAEFQLVIRQAVDYYQLLRERRQLLLQITERNRELEAILAHVKRLEGLLPICAQCKKIRDEQGAWHSMEKYISAHSTVEFTHGLCPECACQLYSDVFPRPPTPPG